MTCPNCGAILKGNETVCPNCDIAIMHVCAKCGAELPADSEQMYCEDCRREFFKRNKWLISLGILALGAVVMLVPDPMPILDELGIGAAAGVGVLINSLRQFKN